jgi:hypothetical protein
LRHRGGRQPFPASAVHRSDQDFLMRPESLLTQAPDTTPPNAFLGQAKISVIRTQAKPEFRA